MPVGIAIKVPSRYNGDGTTNKNITKKKDVKYMSYMIAMTNNKKTVIVTDSRVTFKNNTFNDGMKKLYVNEDNTMALGFIGPYMFEINDNKYIIPNIISEEIFKGKTFEEAMLTKIEGQTLKQLIKARFQGDVLTIYKAEKGGKLTGFDYNVSSNTYKFLEDAMRLVNGDFNNDRVLELLYDETTLAFTGEKTLEEKAKNVMDIVIKVSNELSDAKEINSTIGGQIQSIIL